MQIEAIIEVVKSVRPLFFDGQKASLIRIKGMSDYVTAVDYEVQQILKNGLQKLDPKIQFLGEEGERNDLDYTGKMWVADPVDGTTNLIHRFQMSVVSLALVENGKAMLGIIYQPYTDELFYAERGAGAFLNGVPIKVSDIKEAADSLIILGPTPYYKGQYGDMVMRITKRVHAQCQDIRSLGTAALELAYIACGRAEGYFEKVLQPWDFAAGAIILEEAGGRICDWNKTPLSYDRACSVLADNGNMGDWLFDALET